MLRIWSKNFQASRKDTMNRVWLRSTHPNMIQLELLIISKLKFLMMTKPEPRMMTKLKLLLMNRSESLIKNLRRFPHVLKNSKTN